MTSLDNNEPSASSGAPEKETLLIECKELLGVLQNSIKKAEKNSPEAVEQEAMTSRLQNLITMIESNHPDLPADYQDTITKIKEKLNIPSAGVEKKDLSDEQKKAVDAIKNLKDADSAIKRAKTYATVMDGYCLEALVSTFVPEVGDLAMGAIDTAVFMKLAADVDASLWDRFRIITWQTLDTLLGAIPIVGDVADFFFKSNKRSAAILAEAFEKNKTELEEKYGKTTVDKLMEINTNYFHKASDTIATTAATGANIINKTAKITKPSSDKPQTS